MMDRRDVIAVPTVVVVSLILAVAHQAGSWSDTVTFLVVGTVLSLTTTCLYHVDWRPLRSRSRPRMHY
jgi:RsiW-degrading membrane proteinase PrsW (M82 family)